LFTEYLIVYHLSYVLCLFAYIFCVVGIRVGWFLFTEYLIVSPKLRTLVVCISFLRCWNERRMVFVYKIFNSIVSPKLRTLLVCISFLRCWNQRQVLKDWP
jgi:hypothetical protein